MANELHSDHQQMHIQCMNIGRGSRNTVSLNCVKMSNQTDILFPERWSGERQKRIWSFLVDCCMNLPPYSVKQANKKKGVYQVQSSLPCMPYCISNGHQDHWCAFMISVISCQWSVSVAVIFLIIATLSTNAKLNMSRGGRLHLAASILVLQVHLVLAISSLLL
jgi:hypothetical protein